MSEHVLAEVRDGVAIVTLNRPDRLNAIGGAMFARIDELLSRFDADDNVGCVVLRGAGRAFCAGGDVKEMSGGSESAAGFDERVRVLRTRTEVVRNIHLSAKPWIAMVRGAAAGAGMSLALACDMRIAGETARFITAFARVGLTGDYGGSYFMTRLVGPAKARELYWTGQPVESEEALRLGLVNRVFSDDVLEDETMALAQRLASGPRLAIRYMKRNLNAAVSGTLDQVLDLEALHHARAGQTEDHAEAARAFVEKREPVFRGC